MKIRYQGFSLINFILTMSIVSTLVTFFTNLKFDNAKVEITSQNKETEKLVKDLKQVAADSLEDIKTRLQENIKAPKNEANKKPDDFSETVSTDLN